jgi:hypothetical protein
MRRSTPIESATVEDGLTPSELSQRRTEPSQKLQIDPNTLHCGHVEEEEEEEEEEEDIERMEAACPRPAPRLLEVMGVGEEEVGVGVVEDQLPCPHLLEGVVGVDGVKETDGEVEKVEEEEEKGAGVNENRLPCLPLLEDVEEEEEGGCVEA